MKGLPFWAPGRKVPSRCVTNEEFAHMVDTSDEWIRTRTGIRQRYFCTQGETNAALAAEAARIAMQKAGVTAADIGLCVAATFTADHATPSLACEVHGKLALPQTAPAFDVNAACTGFLTALETARCMLASSALAAPCALVIGSECISRALDFSDRSTCVLFGDGAGAAVVRLSDENPYACMLGRARRHGHLVRGRRGVRRPHAAHAGQGRVPLCVRDGAPVRKGAAGPHGQEPG